MDERMAAASGVFSSCEWKACCRRGLVEVYARNWNTAAGCDRERAVKVRDCNRATATALRAMALRWKKTHVS